MTIHKRTRRNLSPLARDIVDAINDCDAAKRRLKRLLPRVQEAERLAILLLEHDPGLAASNNDELDAIKKRIKGRLPRNRRRFDDDQLKEQFAQSASTEYAVGSGFAAEMRGK